MTIADKRRWKEWADELRQQMMTSLTSEVTKSVESIASETATSKPERTLRSARFWRACQTGKSPNDVLTIAGFEIAFQEDKSRKVQDVTLRLNDSWMQILHRVRERQKGT
jgi:hypothetical protein